MNTIRTYAGESNKPPGFEVTKQHLEFQMTILIDVVQALLERVGEKEGKKLGVLSVGAPGGPRYIIYESPEEVKWEEKH